MNPTSASSGAPPLPARRESVRPTLRAVLLQASLALGSFLAGAALLRTQVPLADELHLRAKLEHFAAHKDEYDAIYLGSSRVLRGLDPLRIDADLRQAGLPMRSYNFGVRGMLPFEQDFVLHRLLESGSSRLRWIFFEGGPLSTTLPEHNPFEDERGLFSERGVQWHTPRETRNVLACLRRVRLPLARKLQLARAHLELLGRNLCNLGRGPEILAHWGSAPGPAHLPGKRWERGIEREGFEGNDLIKGGELSPRMEAYRLDPELYQAELARVVRENALPVRLEEVELEIYREQQRAAAQHGVELVYITTPTQEGNPEVLRLHELGHVTTLFHFNDPERYPELFQLDHRFDRGHVNERGAQRFSSLFAQALRAHLEASAGAKTTAGG